MICRAAVMQVGEITFKSQMDVSGDNRGVIIGGEDSPGLCDTCRLLGCTPAGLRDALETNELKIGGEATCRVIYSKIDAEATRDALAKALYDRLFTWLVSQINIYTAPTEAAGQVAANIGVLDIFGVFLLFQPANQLAAVSSLLLTASLSLLCNRA